MENTPKNINNKLDEAEYWMSNLENKLAETHQNSKN